MTKGRPRAFDTDQALDRAVEVFWRKGYEGASLCELTEAMGINPPSLYAAFGNKEELYRKAIARYAAAAAEARRKALDQPTARASIETLLMQTVAWLTDKSRPQFCMITRGTFACQEGSGTPAAQALAVTRADSLRLISERLERAKAEGDLPQESDATALARFVLTVIEGMSVQAAGGTGRKALQEVAKQAMLSFPEAQSSH
jgi:AcrR family transcriptional regulator